MKNKLQTAKGLMGFLLLISHGLYAQFDDGLWTGRQANNWYWSFGQGLTFSNGSPQFAAGGQTTVMEGTAVMSDAGGQLLFYASNGTVWNKNHVQMLNGDNLLSGSQSSTQSGIIVPKPGAEGIYYLFNIAVENGLVYSEIDMSLDNGLGAVTATKNIVLADDARTEKITAVYHADKERIWLISHRSGNNQFIAYLISEAGIAEAVTSAVGYSYTTDIPFEGPYIQEGPAGQLKASPDGSRLAAVQREGELVGSGFVNGKIEVFDFDNTTGVVSNVVQITMANSAYGVEFSPNSHFIYALNDDYRPWVGPLGTTFEKLYQYNLETANIPASGILIGEYNSRYPSALQLAPDGKVYMMNSAGLNTMVAVANPNNLGVAAGFQTNVATLINSDSIGLPTFNQSYFQSGILHEESCDSQVSFELIRIPGATAVAWNFGDPASGAANESATAQHTFSGPGTYTVTAQVTSNGAVQTATSQVIIGGAGGGINTPPDLIACNDGAGSGNFNLGAQTAVILAGLDASAYTVAYHTTAQGALTNTDIITGTMAFESEGQTIYVSVQNTGGCLFTTQFDILLIAAPIAPQLPDLQACGSGNAIFDLTQQNVLLLAGQLTATVTYYTNGQDANAGTNAISAPVAFTNTSSPQTIFAAVSNGTCTSITAFDLLVLPAPVLPLLPNLSLCSPDNDGTAQFDLTVQELLLSPENFPVWYFTSAEDAAANTNFIPFPGAFINTQNPETIYVRAGGDTCYALAAFNVVVPDAPFPDITPVLTGCPPFNLTDAPGETQAGLQFAYYTSEEDATNQVNAITTPQSFNFEGEQAIVYIRAENEAGCSAILPVGLVAEGCDIPRGISPDGDSKNDTFDLAFFNVNRLSIFNRYGIQVYSCINYTNQWHGQTDSQAQLPSGVYYYVIEPQNGAYKTGWVYVNLSAN